MKDYLNRHSHQDSFHNSILVAVHSDSFHNLHIINLILDKQSSLSQFLIEKNGNGNLKSSFKHVYLVAQL